MCYRTVVRGEPERYSRIARLWVAGSVVAVATVGVGLAGSEVGTLTNIVHTVYVITTHCDE